MKYEVVSDHKFVLKTVVGLLEGRDKDFEQFDSTIDYAITELTKIQLRNLAQSCDRRFWDDRDALDLAINEVDEKIRVQIPQFKLGKRYRKSLRALKYPASEIKELTRELSRSRASERIGPRILLSNLNNTHEIVEIGLADSIKGLLAKPVSEHVRMDLEKLKAQGFDIEGEWFPYEIRMEELSYIVDDDGTIYISTDNFPERLLSEARNNLTELVSILFC